MQPLPDKTDYQREGNVMRKSNTNMRPGCRLALSCLLAAGLAGAAALAPAAPALAYDYDQASFLIRPKNNTAATYKVIKLFSANIDPTATANLTNTVFSDATTARYPGVVDNQIEWASDTVKTNTLAFLDTQGYNGWLTSNGYGTDNTTKADVRVAAQFIADKIGNSANINATAVPPTKASQSFALELARYLAAHGVPTSTYTNANGSTAFTGPEGYYLFYTDDASVAQYDGPDAVPGGEHQGEAGTAPIWVPLGGGVTEITEKTEVPTLNKQVKEDRDGQWGYAADANKGQDLSYRIVGTIPDNIASFDTYHYKITDDLTGLDITTSTLRLTIANGSNSKAYTWAQLTAMGNTRGTFTYSNGKLVMDIADIRSFQTESSPVPVTGSTTVTVTYDAHLTDAAVVGPTGNQNKAGLDYTTNPVTDGQGNTPTPTTVTYSYQLDLKKVDKQKLSNGNEKPLPGAKFTFKLTAADGSSDTASLNKYVQADGSLGDSPYEFTTGTDGTLYVKNIDAGTYTVHETQAPDGYVTQHEDFVVTITSELDRTATGVKLVSLGASKTGGEPAASTNSNQVPAKITSTAATQKNTGHIAVTLSDPKIVLPITGMTGVQAAIAGSLAVLAASLLGLGLHARRKRRAEAGGESGSGADAA